MGGLTTIGHVTANRSANSPLSRTPQGTTFKLAGIDLLSYPDPSIFTGGFEVPEDLQIGMETWGSTHKLAASAGNAPKQVFQTFGVFPKPIRWKAKFLGANAEPRSRAFMAVQQNQSVVDFQVGSRLWEVVVFDYVETLHSQFEIEYEIEVRPLRELSGNAPSGQAVLSAQQALSNNYSDLVAQTTVNIPPIDPSTLPSIQKAANQAQSSATSALSAITGAQPETAQSTTTLLGVLSTVETAITDATTAQSLLFSATSSSDVILFLWATQLLGQLQSYRGTLAGVAGSNQATTLAVPPGSNLFMVAATQLGDWTRAFDIAKLNGLSDMFFDVQGASIMLPPAITTAAR